MSKRIFIIAAATLLAWIGPAHATVIGVAVDGVGSTTQVGSTNSDGSINFYALLSGSGTYGVGGAGLSADTCTHSATSPCGGMLDMWLMFSPVSVGPNLLSLRFTDLDIFGVNSPLYFLEAVEIFNSAGVSQGRITSMLDPEVVLAQTNNTNQLLELMIDIDNDPFYARLSFATDFLTANAPYGTYLNTQEALLATVVSVPEPATLSLLGMGLLVLGFSVRRKKPR